MSEISLEKSALSNFILDFLRFWDFPQKIVENSRDKASRKIPTPNPAWLRAKIYGK